MNGIKGDMRSNTRKRRRKASGTKGECIYVITAHVFIARYNDNNSNNDTLTLQQVPC